MVLRLLIDAVHADETRVVIADNNRIHDFDFVTAAKKQVKGNIYLAKITRVEPSLQAAFVEYGGGKQGFLPFAEIHPDYYQIPVADRKRLLEEVEQEADVDGESSAGTAPSSLENVPEGEIKNTGEEAPAFPAVGDAAVEETPIAASWNRPAVFDDSFSDQVSVPDFIAATSKEETTTELALPVFPTASVLEDEAQGMQPPAPETPETDDETSLADLASPLPDMASPAEADNAASAEPRESTETTEIETLANDEEAVQESRRPGAYYRRYKIQEVIKRGQIVLVQVIKEERGNKGVSLTTFLSLAGRYCVLMPNSPKGGGISRKIMSGEDRKRLKEISAELSTVRGMSAIIRTAGIDRTRAEIKRDYEYLVKLWDSIREQTLASTAPALIYEESDLIKRTIRDLYSNDIEEIVVQGETGYTQAKEFLKMLLPSHAARVKLYEENVPLFYAYNIEDQLSSMYEPAVKLRSGGYIVINPTEALISIDVNSGRSTGERNIEETATKTNLEAAQEIARQLRLRDLAGLVVIDFIDMMDSRNRRAVERALKDALRHDRAKIQLGRISPFGLLEMSRQRLRPSLSETSTTTCPHCQGRGVIRSDASVAIQIIRATEKEAASNQFLELKLFVPSGVALNLLNSQREVITSLERRFGVRILVQIDPILPQGTFRIEKIKNSNARRQVTPNNNVPVSMDNRIMDELPPVDESMEVQDTMSPEGEETSVDAGSEPRERSSRRGRRGGRSRRGGRKFRERDERLAGGEEGAPTPQEGEAGETASDPSQAEESTAEGGNTSTEDNGDSPRRSPRGERGGRGRRRRNWRDRPPREGSEGDATGEASNNGASTDRESPRPVAAERNNTIPFTPPTPVMETPRPVSAVQPPPLSEQVPADVKPKKGWWRRIVES